MLQLQKKETKNVKCTWIRASTSPARKTTPKPDTAQPLSITLQGPTMRLLEPNFNPKGNQHQEQLRNITKDCVKKQLTLLARCFWNVNRECEIQNYLVVTPATKPWFMTDKGDYGSVPNAFHENWLNETLPWLWITPLQHFVGSFPAGYAWTGLGLKGPYQTDMYVQKAHTPEELVLAPNGRFFLNPLCVAEKIFEGLNGTTKAGENGFMTVVG